MKSAASGNSGGGLVSSPGNDTSCKDHLDRDHEHGDLREDGTEIFLKMLIKIILQVKRIPRPTTSYHGDKGPPTAEVEGIRNPVWDFRMQKRKRSLRDGDSGQ